VSGESIIPQSPSIETAPQNGATGGKALRWLELSLVLLVGFGSSLFSTVQTLLGSTGTLFRFDSIGWSYQIYQECIGLLFLGYVLWRRKLRFRDIGLRWSVRDIVLGPLVAAAAYASYVVGYLLIYYVYRALFSAAPAGASAQKIFGHPSLLMIPLLILNPFFEELIVRAFLMTEIRDLTGSWILAVVVSVTFQTAYHLYYGWATALSLGFQFLAYSVYYAKTKRATPVILAHGIFDIWGIVRLW
jgi:membrane protease YdiL (CAAX protease family)